MANNPYVNKVELADGTTVMDISDTTAGSGDVLSGSVFYTASGARSVGSLDISGKADKVDGAASGNFAGLDSNGNLTDSGSKASDFLTSHQDITGKADKVSSPTSGNFAGLDSNGNLTDSGHKHSDYLTSHQDITGKLDKDQGSGNSGKFMKVGSDGLLTPDNVPAELPSVTSSDNGKVLTVSSGAWSAQNPTGGAPTTLSLTAAAGSWTSATPPTQTITATGVTSSNTIIVGLADSATSVQLEAAQAGNIRCTAQAAGEITLTCYGTEPTENIPVSVVILG